MSKLKDKILKEYQKRGIIPRDNTLGVNFDVLIDAFEKELADMRKEMSRAIANEINEQFGIRGRK